MDAHTVASEDTPLINISVTLNFSQFLLVKNTTNMEVQQQLTLKGYIFS